MLVGVFFAVFVAQLALFPQAAEADDGELLDGIGHVLPRDLDEYLAALTGRVQELVFLPPRPHAPARDDEGTSDPAGREEDAAVTVPIRSASGVQYACDLVPRKAVRAPLAAAEAPAGASAEAAAALLRREHGSACVVLNGGWWVYEYCFGKGVRQMHFEDQKLVAEHRLGTAPAVASSVPPRTLLLRFQDGGSVCDVTGRPRSVAVRHTCGPNLKEPRISGVAEPSTCAYVLDVEVPALCRLPQFADAGRPPIGDATVECREVVDGPARLVDHALRVIGLGPEFFAEDIEYRSFYRVPEDDVFATARELLERASAQGSSDADSWLGYMFQMLGMPDKAAVHWERAMDRGDSDARLQLAVLTIAGMGVAKDVELGVQLVHEAAVAGVPEALYLLARFHLRGEHGVSRDRSNAEQLAGRALAAAQARPSSADAAAGLLWIVKRQSDGSDELLLSASGSAAAAPVSPEGVFQAPRARALAGRVRELEMQRAAAAATADKLGAGHPTGAGHPAGGGSVPVRVMYTGHKAIQTLLKAVAEDPDSLQQLLAQLGEDDGVDEEEDAEDGDVYVDEDGNEYQFFVSEDDGGEEDEERRRP